MLTSLHTSDNGFTEMDSAENSEDGWKNKLGKGLNKRGCPEDEVGGRGCCK